MKKIITPQVKVLKTFEKGHPAFMPYYTLGYPDYETSLSIVEACADNGADLMELGIPFSDPLADGPTIQRSTQIALQNGINVANCLDGVNALRKRGLEIPLMLMGYFNPILAYGLNQFTKDAYDAGANGFIIPDLPPEEAESMIALCKDFGLAMTFLLAPNSPNERIEFVTRVCTGFVYLVSVTGITGARDTIPGDMQDFIARVRQKTTKPLAVGFGISNPQQASFIGQIADGVIVGSALITATQGTDDPVKAAGNFVKAMVTGIQ
jgi:tryptophan synthase alpha chain